MSYYRKLEDKRRLKKLASKNGSVWYSEEDKRYLRWYKTPYWKYLKRESNKRIRQYTKKDGFYSKKIFDIWWSYD